MTQGARTRAVLAGLAGLGLAACGLPDGEYFGKVPDPDPDHLTFCNSGEPEYLDPALATSTTDMKPIYAMFDGLTDFGLDGLPEPSVATSWDIAPDLRTFTFHLRDDARWSDGRPLTAHDFAYQIVRVLHPVTTSKNAETHWKLKNGELYTANRVRRMTGAAGGFAMGDIVEIVGVPVKTAKFVGDLDDIAENDPEAARRLRALLADPEGVIESRDLAHFELPDSNARTSRAELHLRDLEAPAAEAYATVPAGEEVLLVDRGSEGAWSYVYWDHDDGVYGWVPTTELGGQPNSKVPYTVRRVPANHIPGQSLPPEPEGTPRPTGVVPGSKLVMLPDVLGVRATDDHTLVLETWGPLPYMIDLTPQRAFRATPRWAVSRHPRRWTYPENIVTSGAYHMEDWRIRDRIELVRSKTFWDAANVKVGRFTVFSMNEQTANANLYIQGGCDALTANNIPSSYLPFLTRPGDDGKPRFKDFTLAPALGIYDYLINTQKFPNVHFRRALNFGVDRTQIPFITHGGEFPSAQFMPGVPIAQLSDADLALCGVSRDRPGVAAIVEKGKLCYVPPPGLDFDLDKAKAEIALARKEMGASFPKSFAIKFNSGVESHKLIAEFLQHEWSTKLGLTVTLESQEWKTFLKDTVAGEYDVARMGWIGNFPDPEAEFMPQFKCKSPDNRTRFCSQEFDDLMAKAEGTLDRKERLRLTAEAERVMIEAAPSIPMYVYTWKHLQKPYVRDLAMNLPDQVAFRKAWIDPDWQERKGAPQARAAGAP